MIEDRRFPDAMPQPTDEDYPVAPPVDDWSGRTDRGPAEAKESYEVGEEIDEAPFRTDAETWRELVADPYKVGEVTGKRPSRAAAIAAKRTYWAAREKSAAAARIGKWNDPRRITLRGLLFCFTLASLTFALGSRLPRGAFAGLAGLAALLIASGSRTLIGDSAPAKAAWWTLMGVYLVAAVCALVRV